MPSSRLRGMTLLELLVVVAVVAALAGIGWSAYEGVYVAEQATLGRTQLQVLADAARRFKADTGYWPGQGPFALASAANVETTVSPRVVQCSDTSAGLWVRGTLPNVHIPGGVTDVGTWVGDWYAHPANLWLLMARPTLCANHVLGRLQDWDAASARGWRGPYVRGEQLGLVEVSNALAADGSGDPTAGVLQKNLRGLGAGRELAPVGLAYTDCGGVNADCAFRWRRVPTNDAAYDAQRHSFDRRARPLFYFPAGRPRVAWAGPDGRFGGLNPANAPNACDPVTGAAGGDDDVVICLD
ncbi:MAG: prepilin-type N-terminal cleavage/methylation domain-containing protein [Rubrivivax sp.]